ncbi:hypothetical protein BDV33DRAFT_163690 [Aspergillus novoparasiticus]|uniref:Uncharacterized protein n=1 Tax=Aspergillus novoparasiticus TaxID=986946 RepID=A0A5N6F9P2_9EURO|nr:hypothetical protein BDV33DRAFT_163690 [Aspergillus novoparasiticus]
MRWYVVDRWPVSNVPLIARSLACDRGFGILASIFSRGLLSYLVCLVLVLILPFCVWERGLVSWIYDQCSDDGLLIWVLG